MKIFLPCGNVSLYVFIYSMSYFTEAVNLSLAKQFKPTNPTVYILKLVC